MKEHLMFVGCLSSQQHASVSQGLMKEHLMFVGCHHSNMPVYLRDR